MTRFPKAASLAAISVTLLAAGISADAGFAFGLDQNDTALKADTIRIDEATLAADQDATQISLQSAKSAKFSPALNTDGSIVFAPGTGKAPEIVSDPAEPAVAQKPETPRLSASSLAELVRLQDTKAPLDAEAHCLAGAVYFESKGESLSGQLAVARVVMARAKSGRFPGSLCGVVFQKSQFSFVRGHAMPNIDKGSQNWRNAVAISKIAMDSAWKSPVEGALYFHARYVSPGWRLSRIGMVDNHVFYR